MNMRKIKTTQLKTQNKDNDNEVYRISDGGAGIEDSMIQDYGRMRINNGDTTMDDRSRARNPYRKLGHDGPTHAWPRPVLLSARSQRLGPW